MPTLVFRYDEATGALLCDSPIKGLTQELPAEAARAYGGEHLVGETISRRGAKMIAEKFGGELVIE